MKTIQIPELTLLALIGPSGSGKSTFARQHFLPTEVISSDYCRGLVSDDENNQHCSKDAFDVLYYIAAKRLAAGKLVVVDATNVRPEDRRQLVALARQYHVRPSAIVFDLPEQLCHERNASRPDRAFGPHVIRQHMKSLHRSMRGLVREGFRHIAHLKTEEEVNAAVIERQKLWNDKREEHGPFDIIGDVHGCYAELLALLEKLGYQVTGDADLLQVQPPAGRKAVFVGDLVDRGPDSPAVLKLVMHMVRNGTALCVPGNHDVKLMRKLWGKQVKLTHGLEETMQQLAAYPAEFHTEVADFLESLVSHYVLDDGRLVVAHAGMKAEMQGRASGEVRSFALYGETTGEDDEYGLPVRYDWANDYRGDAMVVYGHTPSPRAEWINRTLCVDTGCVFGGHLTALRYPEREIVSVPALQVYYEPVRPLEEPQTQADTLRGSYVLDIDDVLGKRHIQPRLGNSITIREAQARAALEVMSRFAMDPRWLVYLPPTMSPPATSALAHYLEYPTEAFDYYRHAGVTELVCEEKHMGSRAVMVLCRDEEAVRRRFGIEAGGRGAVYTRTGRAFFNDADLTRQVLEKADNAMQASGLWQSLQTDWIVLDMEILPWSAKSGELLRQQYAPTGASALANLGAVSQWMEMAAGRGVQMGALPQEVLQRKDMIQRYIDEYRNYCWEVNSVDDLRLAPFQILAYEGRVGMDADHRWHLDMLDQLCAADLQLFKPTGRRFVDLSDPASEQEATSWWEALTGEGRGEGMVIKPVAGIVKGEKGLMQPAIKCRGREYLRIIYGPTYSEPENLERLRKRGLGLKRALALREFVLGYEALHRFVSNEPHYRVHECVFGVLALESEPVDPRL
ncbi:polynucleotide kinase-phosphatase [Saezia sanguinis]|uniref:polynucleotide kinase-phosphatase n=1 Tax=Saezia sanguinis TaxID=1965230 RepID=UPI00303F9B2F